MIRFTNTLTGQKEEFRPLDPPRVTMYVCGVTVYDDCHIGHARGAVVFDVLRRFLAWRGFEVSHVRNITDVDDKIIGRAWEEGGQERDLKARVLQVARRYTESFQNDFARLGLLRPDHEPKATEYIPQMIAFIQGLLERGMAYVSDDGAYFAVRKLSDYGKLSHQKLDQMLEGDRPEAGEGKKDPLDFALWKKAKPEEPNWESPWGPGRPGWHIECSTMSTQLLGDAFDIHGGGQDLIFPHHENERAQALGAGRPFARVWLHNGLLTIGGQKMAKSLGNFVTVDEALKRHPSPDVLRLFFLSAHYRSPLDFTWERLEEAAHAYDTLKNFLSRVDVLGEGESRLDKHDQEIIDKFYAAMDDDLNTPSAISCLHWFVTAGDILLKMRDQYKMPESEPDLLVRANLRAIAKQIRELGAILGLHFGRDEIPPEIRELARKRDEARRAKRYDEADLYRKQIMEQGFVMMDTGGKTIIRRQI